MTREEKTEYLRIALSLQNIGINYEGCDRVIETYEKVLKLKGEFSISDAVEIQMKLDAKYIRKELENENT